MGRKEQSNKSRTISKRSAIMINEMVKEYAETRGRTQKEAREDWLYFFDYIKKHLTLLGSKMTIRGLGTLYIKKTNPRKARNPRTGESIDVPEKLHLRFRASKKFETELNN